VAGLYRAELALGHDGLGQLHAARSWEALRHFRESVALHERLTADFPKTHASGAHACLGMGLVRLELEAALLTLFRRLPHLRFDPGNPAQRRCETLFFRGFEALPAVTS
jgi:cytochrome P450